MLDTLNAILDRLPGPEFRLGRRAVPSFLAAAIVGLATGSLWLVALTAACGGDVLVAFGLIPIGATASLALALVRKRRAGIERWVLLEHLAASLGAMTAALWVAGEPLLPWLDRIFAGTCMLYFFGRLGCACAGCCFGHRSSVGIDGGPGHVEPGRRFPVQLVEAACWLACAALSVVLLAVAAPGIAFGTAALVYAVARFFLEGLRADPRPRLLGLSESRWLALAMAAAAVLALQATHRVSSTGLWIGGAGAVATGLLWLTSRRWLRLPAEQDEPSRGELVAFAQMLASRGPDNTLHRVEIGGRVVVASWVDSAGSVELYVSVSAQGGVVLGPADATLVLEAVCEGLGIRDGTPGVVETGPGRYVARFAREVIELAPASPAPAVEPPVAPGTDSPARPAASRPSPLSLASLRIVPAEGSPDPIRHGTGERREPS